MDSKKKGEYIGVLGALLVHLLLFALLIWLTVTISLPPKEDGGVFVMLGNTEAASGEGTSSPEEGEPLPTSAATPTTNATQAPSEEELITQKEEETVVVPPKTVIKKEKPKVTQKPEPVKTPEKSAAERAAEAKRATEAKAEAERKAADEAARRQVSNAFNKGAQMDGSKGTASAGAGTQGSTTGNAPTGALSGTGGYGTFDLGGRSIGAGGLPRPAYNVQEEGRVVVSITVNPAGEVIQTQIHPQTNTVNSTLRRAAEEAARKARFNTVEGTRNQTGTITYNFKLR